MLAQHKGPVICVTTPDKNTYSETFIRAHIERLPATVKLLYGGKLSRGELPYYTEDDQPLVSSRFHYRIVRAILRRLLNLPSDHFHKMAILRFLKVNQVNAVLAEYGPTGVAMMDICQDAGIPLITHFHGFDAFDRRILDNVGQRYPELFGVTAALIVVSHDMERQLLALGAPKEKLYCNPYGVDTSLFNGADPGSAPPLFVAVGRFVDKKAPHLTLLAFKKVADECPEARLIMIGDGPLWEASKQIAKALDLKERVEFWGPRPHCKVAMVMRKARAFVQHSVQTSYGDSEGTPVAVLEASASGLPIVSTRHGGIRDVVLEGETGFLVNEGDIEGMADRMLLLAKDPKLAAKMGRAARERICSKFSMERSIGRLWEIIQKVIE